jgi:hypothetical protein
LYLFFFYKSKYCLYERQPPEPWYRGADAAELFFRDRKSGKTEVLQHLQSDSFPQRSLSPDISRIAGGWRGVLRANLRSHQAD